MQKAHLQKALVMISEKKFNPELARREAITGLQFIPDDFASRFSYCRVLAGTNLTTDREKAIEELSSLTVNDESPQMISDAFNLLGLLYYKNGELKRALMALQNALDLNPANQQAFQNQKLVQAHIQSSEY